MSYAGSQVVGRAALCFLFVIYSGIVRSVRRYARTYIEMRKIQLYYICLYCKALQPLLTRARKYCNRKCRDAMYYRKRRQDYVVKAEDI